MPRFSVRICGLEESIVSIPFDCVSKDEFLSIKIIDMKIKLFQCGLQNVSFNFEGQSLKDHLDFRTYNIQNQSSLRATVSIMGGASSQQNPYAHCLQYTTMETDAIAYDDSEPRVFMSCGHAVSPCSLSQYCKTKLQDGNFDFDCPAVDKKCGKTWAYPEIRMKAGLTQLEMQEFESKMSQYAARQYAEIKQCPKCNTFIERQDLTNLRVSCQICRQSGIIDFCWQCLHDWSGPTTSNVKCGRSDCVNPLLKSLQCSSIETTFQFDGIRVPRRRACPTCGNVVEHKGQGCKMILCRRCNKEFCFICLELSEVCLRKRRDLNWHTKCVSPLAPIQTSIPVWKRN